MATNMGSEWSTDSLEDEDDDDDNGLGAFQLPVDVSSGRMCLAKSSYSINNSAGLMAIRISFVRS